MGVRTAINSHEKGITGIWLDTWTLFEYIYNTFLHSNDRYRVLPVMRDMTGKGSLDRCAVQKCVKCINIRSDVDVVVQWRIRIRLVIAAQPASIGVLWVAEW